MVKVLLSPEVFESLARHLARIEEERDRFLTQLFPYICRERTELEQQIDQYSNQISRLLKSAGRSDQTDNALPFVVIDSNVTVWDLNRERPLQFHMTGPCPGNKAGGCISCLSPVGKSLLLREVGDEVSVQAPGGVFLYRIQSIQLAPTQPN